eukprot:TRINITY_DN26412_c0_g1_i2.p1 TRINITY_DN26412_c0_g1~~TRINITY_DN26412_c0_g1_i2.p1  ORF type:complete len:194 (-),score=34.45 TRINITY_DN26412_c0_g1_i2:335-916(-)
MRVPCFSKTRCSTTASRLGLAEAREGRLGRLEFSLPPEMPAMPLEFATPETGALQVPVPVSPRNGLVTRWFVWPPLVNPPAAGPEEAQAADRQPPVEVILRLDYNDGVSLELLSDDEKSRAHVYRVLKQYCVCDLKPIHPIPDAVAKASKVNIRDLSNDIVRNRLLGRKLPESGTQMLEKCTNKTNRVGRLAR